MTSVAGVPGEPNLFYSATAGGGVWETDDHGHNWKNISDTYFKNNSIGAISITTSNPQSIYAGTGDSAIRNTFLAGEGMYKSTDGGATRGHLGPDQTHVIIWINVDPNNPDVVYVAAMGRVRAPNAERCVCKSTDGGKSWK